MNRLTELVPATIYGMIGAGALIFGGFVFYRIGFVKNQEHLVLEFAAGALAVGLISVLVATRFRQSWPWRVAVWVFLFLIAVIHIGDYLVDNVPVTSPMLNCVPLAFVTVAELAAWRMRRPSGKSWPDG
jgi:hypothetical protein